MATRPTMTADDRVRALFSKTVESGCTAGEENLAVRKGFQLLMQYGLDLGDFVLPPRYRAVDGLVVPASAVVERVVRDRTSTGKTIRAVCEGLLLAGASMDAILTAVHDEFPGAETTKGCVSWYKSKLIKAGRMARGSVGGTRAGAGGREHPVQDAEEDGDPEGEDDRGDAGDLGVEGEGATLVA